MKPGKEEYIECMLHDASLMPIKAFVFTHIVDLCPHPGNLKPWFSFRRVASQTEDATQQ